MSHGTRPRRLLVWAPAWILIAGLVAWAHWPVLSAQAIMFDDDYLFNNILLQTPSWASAGRCFSEVSRSSTVEGYYEPLTLVSLMLDVRLGGRQDNLRPFHRTSLILHVADTLLLIVLLYLLFDSPWIAALLGLLFGVHPLTVEPLAWVWERKTLLAAFFCLLSLIAYVMYVRRRRSSTPGYAAGDSECTGNRRGRAWYLLSIGCFVLALLSKPTSTPLPLVLLLLDYWPLRRWGARAVKEKIPFFIIAVASAVVTVISTANNAGITLLDAHSATQIPLRICYLIVFYLRKIAWPTDLSPVYPLPDPLSLSHPAVLMGVLGTMLLMAGLVLSLRWTRAWVTGALIFFLALSPTLGVIGYSWVSASDKYVYLPLVGLLISLTWLLSRVDAGKVAIRGNARMLRTAWVAFALGLAVCEARATRRYLEVWQGTEPLLQHILRLAPRSAAAHNSLGVHLGKRGELDRAITHLREAVSVRPGYADAHNNLGLALSGKKEWPEAAEHFRRAITLNSDFAAAHINRGNAFVQQGRADEAIVEFLEALKRKPDDLSAHFNLGMLLAGQGKTDEAIAHLLRVVDLNPDDAAAQYQLACLLDDRGRTDEAIDHYGKALQLTPTDAGMHNRFGVALAQREKVDAAISHFREAVRLNSGYTVARKNLARALSSQQQWQDAMEEYREVLRREPQDANARIHLAQLLERQGRRAEAIQECREALRINPQHQPGQRLLKELSTSPTSTSAPAS